MKTLAMVLTPGAAGDRLIDPRNPTGGTAGGGSRAGYMGLVRAMGRLGKYRTIALGPFRELNSKIDGVEYRRADQLFALATELGEPPDVQFCFYDTTPLINCRARLRIASHHTLIPFHSWPWADINTAPCQWAADFLRQGYRPNGNWKVLPNAVEGLEDVHRAPVPGRVIYHTSPDRGLHLLFAAWPEIRKRVPEATLHVVGNVDEAIAWSTFPHLARSYEGRRGEELARNMKAAQEAGGVKLLGRLSRPALLRELAAASCFAFPAEVSAPCETWSISIHECLTIGLPVVLSPVDALESIWGGAVALCPSPARLHLEDFIEGVTLVLTKPEHAQDCTRAGYERAALYSFDKSAQALDTMIEEWFEKNAPAPAPLEERNPGFAQGAAE